MLLQFTVRIRRFLLGGRFGIDVDSVLDLFVLLGSFLWDLLLFCADFGLLYYHAVCVRYQSPDQTKEYAVTVAVCGATNPASNCAQHTTSYYDV
jgi:hypothetical protein